MSVRDYERKRTEARAARDEAKYLRDLHAVATCGLPMEFTGVHYGMKQVRKSIAMRVADQYLLWADEYDAIAARIEGEMETMLSVTPTENGENTHE